MTNRILALVFAVIAFLPGAASARLIPNASGNAFNLTTNPPTADLWCNGGQVLGNGTVKAYTELCQDSTGSLLPTSTLGTQNLGSSTFPFATIYSAAATITGSDTAGTVGVANVSGSTYVVTGAVAATQSIVNGLTVLGKAAIGTADTAAGGVWVSSCIPVLSSYETVISSGAASVTLTSTPSISTSTIVGGTNILTSGTYLVLSSTAAAGVIFQDDGTLSGSKLQLGAATREVKIYKTLVLIYDAADGFWREISYGNN